MICLAGVASVVLLICLKPYYRVSKDHSVLKRCHGAFVSLLTVEWSIKDVTAGGQP